MKQLVQNLSVTLAVLMFVIVLFPQTGYASYQVFVEGGNVDLTIYTPSGKLTLDVSPGDSIESVKAKITGETGIPPDKQRLFFEGTELEDGQTIGYYYIQKEATIHLYVIPDVPSPSPAPDMVIDDYYQRHYDFWVCVLGQLDALDNSGTVTVDTAGQNLDHIQHFVFDALKNTSRILTVKHQGQTYVIQGQKESADFLWMGEIALGHNHAFSILGAYRR
ncbi:hypothetical protein LJC04_06740 [Ruminococcaceae bacterium OttesenSCG-928-O06]|nr:hypothetical protein [Ruminococcaceae bacterium OttesenSCG-928-O06]